MKIIPPPAALVTKRLIAMKKIFMLATGGLKRSKGTLYYFHSAMG